MLKFFRFLGQFPVGRIYYNRVVCRSRLKKVHYVMHLQSPYTLGGGGRSSVCIINVKGWGVNHDIIPMVKIKMLYL